MQAVQALPASFGSSLRPVSTSNGAGSRAAGSRGPWSSAELATRPVRKGPPKPKGNAPDSRKTRTSNHRIPGAGRGLMIQGYKPGLMENPFPAQMPELFAFVHSYLRSFDDASAQAKV